MAKAHTKGSGWHKESLRHSHARRFGKATPRYSGMMTRPINKSADKIFYYESPDTNFDQKQLAIGTNVEFEHTKDPKIAKGEKND